VNARDAMIRIVMVIIGNSGTVGEGLIELELGVDAGLVVVDCVGL